MPKRVAYLGPKGTYAEQAAYALAKLENIHKPEFIPCTGMFSVISQVASQDCDLAVVPIENSVEGGVTTVLDALWRHPNLFIRRALVMPIRHCLVGNGSITEITEVLSHPQALAQCSHWLNTHLPNALQLPTSSTAEAVKLVGKNHFQAAIGSKPLAKIIGINTLAFPINDVPGNRTRFVLLDNKESDAKGNIASLAFSLHENAPGALLKALSYVADLGLNMSRIESRPSKRELGEYVFFIDVELPNINSNLHHQLIAKINPLCEHLVHFGAYPSTELDLDYA